MVLWRKPLRFRLLNHHRWSKSRRLFVHPTGERAAKRRAVALLQRSALFDGQWYLRNYPDVAENGLDPARHYLDFGWREGRDPSPHFSTSDYLRANADVAHSGSNPLLHFIEFGYSEGRGRTKHRAPVPRVPSPGEPFGEAAPCFSQRLADDLPVRWRRSIQFETSSADLVVVNDLPIGLAADVRQRVEVEGAFANLRRLSGYAQSLSHRAELSVREPACSIADAWYIDQGRLRTRWHSTHGPVVIRAYQHDPQNDGRLAMVGEGLCRSAIDIVDVALCNSYFPLLFIIAEPGGIFWASQLLAFPSLCRGGLHYAELLAVSDVGESNESQSLDLVGHGRALSAKLLSICEGEFPPLISALVVDLVGADGAQPLFQSDFQVWLARVARISLGSSGTARRDSGQDFLASAFETSSEFVRASKGGSLVLAPDMIPTISSLVAASACDEGEPAETALSLIVSEPNPSQPATLFKLPLIVTGALRGGLAEYPRAWPVLRPGKHQGFLGPPPVAAIRLRSERELADAELLVPSSSVQVPASSNTPSIIWLIWPEDWSEVALSEALEALALQGGANRHEIVFIGQAGPEAIRIAKRQFENRVHLAKSVEAGLHNLRLPLVGYLGPGVVLHDQRCSLLLSALFEDATVATASCVGVHSESRGKRWNVTVADAGSSTGGMPIQASDVQKMWRGAYPVARPPRDFWISRRELLEEWVASGDATLRSDATHVCTSLVTVSLLAKYQSRQPSIQPPAASLASHIQTQALFG